MAKAVTPIDFDASGSWRWHVRTDSIRATTEALSGLWGRVAQEAAGDTDPGTSEAVVSGDPRMPTRLDRGDDDGVRVRTRTSVLTLVVVAPRPELVERAVEEPLAL